MPRKDRPPARSVKHARMQKALRESVILRELGDILNSSLDIEHILQELVKRTTELCEVARCAVWLLEEPWNRFRPVTYYIASPEIEETLPKSADAIWHRSPLPIDNPIIQRLLATGGMLAIEDLRMEESVRPFAQTFLVHSVLLISLTREGRPVGMMSLDNPGQIHPFSHEQQQLARAIGQQATVAIDNARLYQQAHAQQQRAENLIARARAIYQVAMTVNSGEELPVVLQLATNHLVKALGASGGVVLLLEEGDTILHPVEPTSRLLGDALSATDLTLNRQPSFQRAISTGKPILVNAHQADEHEITWLRQPELKHVLVVPLMGSPPQRDTKRNVPTTPQQVPAEDEAQLTDLYCLGLIVIHYTTQRKPTRGEYAFAQDIAAQCALAIEKARLLAETQRAADLANERANTLDAVFQAMTEGITVLTLDEQVLARNHAAAHFLGFPVYSTSSIRTFLQHYPAYTLDGKLIPYEDFPLLRALRGEAEVRNERLLLTRADGVRRVMEITATPLRASNQQQVGLVTAFRDITVQMQAETNIHQALETFLHIAEAVSYSTDIDEMLRSVLNETLTMLHCKRGMVHLYQQTSSTFEPLLSLGFSLEEEVCWLQKQQTWLAPQDGQTNGVFTRLMQGYATLINQEYQATPADRFAESMLLAAPIQHNQQILGLLLLERSLHSTPTAPIYQATGFTDWDITIVEGIAQLTGVVMEQARWQQEAIAARAGEAAMREADTMKNEFLAITAHEFRNPLTVILARSQGALRALRKANNGTAPATITDHLETIIAQTKQLNNIVTTFLDAARINQGKLNLQAETVDLGKVAQQVAKNQAPLAEHHTLRCFLQDPEKPYLVKGDPARLAQVIANLVENAIKYSPMGGPVTISLRRYKNGQPELIEVSVRDQGLGIPPDAQTRLFERFYRVPHATSGETRGIGLGLYIVAQLVQLHGGNIRVESSGIPGEGSCFLFTLPELITSPTNEPPEAEITP